MKQQYTISKRAVILWLVFIVFLCCVTGILVYGHYARGKAIDEAIKKLEKCEGVAQKPRQATDDRQKDLEIQELKSRLRACEGKLATKPPVVQSVPLPVVAQSASPAVVAVATSPAAPPAILTVASPASKSFTLIFDIVRWDDKFREFQNSGRLFSQYVREYILEQRKQGKFQDVMEPIMFKIKVEQGAERFAGKVISINGEARTLPSDFSSQHLIEMTAINGRVTVKIDPSFIGSDTKFCIWPSAPNVKFASPPESFTGEQLPLITVPGSIRKQIDRGDQGAVIHFILAPSVSG